MDYAIVWFVLLMVLLLGYAILDGFDLGVGIVHPLARGDRDRRIVINSIGPLWDGNEVWLVTFGGALFAAFPVAYATILSGLYLPVMVVLCGLVGRAISIEFRSKSRSAFWRGYWDFSFFLSSITVTFVFGVALGNVVRGLPLRADLQYAGGLSELFDPFSIAVGLLAVAGAAMHGANYLLLKTDGALHRQVRRWAWTSFGAFALLYIVVSALAISTLPHATANFERLPIAWVVVVLNVLAVANIPRALYRDRPGMAFVSSCCTIAALTFLVAVALFPNLVVSSVDPANNLEIHRAASSVGTLRRMFIIALIGMPLVATYTTVVYWVFRGKTRLDETSY